MRVVLKGLMALAGGAFLGLAVTWLAVARGMSGDVASGPWHTSLLIGSAESDPLLRARVALHGLFALKRSETIYYTAMDDSDNLRLDGRCVYAVEGRDPPARWWSITAYGADDFLIPNAAGRYAVSRTRAPRRADGSFAARVGPGGDIATDGGAFTLTLRLYNPEPSVAGDPAHVALPTIRKVRCP